MMDSSGAVARQTENGVSVSFSCSPAAGAGAARGLQQTCHASSSRG
ncbi:MAG: hypothetical protein ACLS69_07270 [Butyricicoccus sp.]